MGQDKQLKKEQENSTTSDKEVVEESSNEIEKDFLIESSQMVATEPVSNGPPKKYMTRIIGPGWGSSGYYSEDILKKAVEDGVFHMGMHSYEDHPTTTEKRERRVRSVRAQLGFLGEDSKYDINGSEGPGIYAPLSVFRDRREFVAERAKSTGLSMHVLCEFRKGKAEGRYGNIVTRMIKEDTNSVDMVSVAGAGGKFGAILESKLTPDLNSEEEDVGTTTVEENAETTEVTENTQAEDAGGKEMSTANGFDIKALDSPIAQEMYESKREFRIETRRMAEELRDLKVSDICNKELAQQSLMEVTREHLSQLLPDQIKKERDCFDEDGNINESKTREFIIESVNHHREYLEALDRERTHGIQRFQVVNENSSGSYKNGNNGVPPSQLEEAFMGLGYSQDQARKAFG